MEQITKFFKTIAGIIILLCCFLPFASLGGLFSVSGYKFLGGSIGYVIFVLLIICGAIALIYVDLAKKDIAITLKLNLSCLAKYAILGGSVLTAFFILIGSFGSIGIGLILVIIVAIALLFEDRIKKPMETK